MNVRAAREIVDVYAEVGRRHKLRLRIGTLQGEDQQAPQIELIVRGDNIQSADAGVRPATVAVLVVEK